MSNPFKNRTLPLNGPAADMAPVVPNDGQDLPDVAVALYVENGGAVSFVSIKGFERTVEVGDRAVLPVGIVRVNATGTTATGLHAFVI
ncbi:spike base protein, RCAP_Rcc01079 family [Parasulfitobacter algicola]|uniref:Uncharacterized protein n=1 Tax=Parasulfitobacter algicola TaxID=2614809 RepID=A0ABX2IND6_9RHOB|nr:hypothetical protein [Sulfitobacter algicola]NSX53870.1 hypothetical protein [Sulfitobacter algicola]